jgi:hypothetical protein
MGRTRRPNIRSIQRYVCVSCQTKVSIGFTTLGQPRTIIQLVCERCERPMRTDGFATVPSDEPEKVSEMSPPPRADSVHSMPRTENSQTAYFRKYYG